MLNRATRARTPPHIHHLQSIKYYDVDSLVVQAGKIALKFLLAFWIGFLV